MPRDDAGASDVTGALLMVAITVVLGAVVWVAVDSWSPSPPPPGLGMRAQPDGTVDVVRADAGMRWGDLRITDTDPAADCEAPDADVAVQPGSVLDCSALAPGSTVTVVHLPSGTMVQRLRV